MANTYKLAAQTRDRAGKGIARALRRSKQIPAVVYGDHKEPVLISLSSHDVELEYHKAHMFTMICNMETNSGDKMSVLARDIQLHPVTSQVLHIDFLRVSKKTKIAVAIPVHFINEENCVGLTENGVLNTVRHDVELMCSATDIPEFIELDLSPFKIGDSLKLSDIVLPEGAVPVEERDLTIATIIAPKTADEPIDSEEADAAEGEGDAEADAEAPSSEESK